MSIGKLQYKVTKAAADGTGTVEVYAPVNKRAASITIPGTVPKAKRTAYRKLFKGKGQGKKVTIK